VFQDIVRLIKQEDAGSGKKQKKKDGKKKCTII